MPSARTFAFHAPLWRHDGGGGAWWFVTVPFDVCDDIEEATSVRGGFGSIRVEAMVGASVWRTSLFPSTRARSLILPVKKSVRAAEGLAEGGAVEVSVTVI
jgi:hypothetical protein